MMGHNKNKIGSYVKVVNELKMLLNSNGVNYKREKIFH